MTQSAPLDPTLPPGAGVRLAISNIAGGEGKTMLSRELAFILHDRGFKVALIDLDPQASLSRSLGCLQTADGFTDEDHTVARVFFNLPLPEPLSVLGVDIWPGGDNLVKADSMLGGNAEDADKLKLALDAMVPARGYDVLILDCKPQRSNLLVASVAAADAIVMPVSTTKGIENADQVTKLLIHARRINPNLDVAAVVPNRMRGQLVHHRNILSYLQESMSQVAPITHPVRDAVPVLGPATDQQIPALHYAPSSAVVEDLQIVADDLLRAVKALDQVRA